MLKVIPYFHFLKIELDKNRGVDGGYIVIFESAQIHSRLPTVELTSSWIFV